MSDRPDPFDRAVDVALEERLGGAHPPDLREAVLARLEREAGAPQTRQLWLAAAVLLLGAGVVFAVLALRDDGRAPEPHGAADADLAPSDPAEAPPDPPQDPEPDIVHPESIDELRRLFARSTRLVVRVRGDRGIDVATDRAGGTVNIAGVDGPGLQRLAAGPLRKLEPAAWTWTHEIDALLGDGTALRIAWNPLARILGVQGFGDVAVSDDAAVALTDAVTTIGRDARIAQGNVFGDELALAEQAGVAAGGFLSLHGATDDDLARLARPIWTENLRELLLLPSPESGGTLLSPQWIESLPILPRLRRLVWLGTPPAGARIAPGQLPRLHEQPALRELRLAWLSAHPVGDAAAADATVLHEAISLLRHVTSLSLDHALFADANPYRHLDPRSTPRDPRRRFPDTARQLDISHTDLGAAFFDALRERRIGWAIDRLELRGGRGIDYAALKSAFESTSVRELLLGRNPLLAAGDLAPLLRAVSRNLVTLRLSGRQISIDVLHALVAAHGETLASLALPADGTPLLDAFECEILPLLPRLQELVLEGQTELTDRALAALAAAPALRIVDLTGCTGVTAGGIEALRAQGVTVVAARR